MKTIVKGFYSIMGWLLAWPFKMYKFVENDLDWDDEDLTILITFVLQGVWVLAILVFLTNLIIK